MRTPRPLIALSAAIVLALGAAACGDDADEDPLGGDDTTTSTTEATDDDGGDDGGTDGSADDSSDDDGGDTGGDVDIPSGWQVVDGDGVSIAVPGDWLGVPIEELALGEDDLQELLPDTDEALLNQASQVIAQGGVLLAFGPPQDDFTDNVNILAMPVPATMDQLEQEAEAGMAQLGADVISMDRVDLPLGEALRVEYALTFQAPDGPATVEGIQYFVPQDRMTYVMTVTASSDPGAVADDMAASLQVG